MSEALDYGVASQRAHTAGLPGGVSGPPRHWWNNWLLLTSRRVQDESHASLTERELLRRSRLLSWILLGMFAVELLLLLLDSRDSATLLSVVIALSGTVASALLNRLGYVSAAGVLLVLLVIAAVMGAVTNSPGHILDTVYLPAYDLLAIAVIIAASVLPRLAGFFIAGASIALICVDFSLQPKGADLLHQIQINGALSMIARPIVLQVIVATVAFLWVRGAEAAIKRADRAEELAALEHAFAEQRRQLEIGVQQILETHVRVANGDFAARAPMNQDNLLWQIAASLNNLLGRLQKSGQAEYQLRRTEDEVRRLVSAIDEARAGRRPIWPAPTGTVADLLVERVVSPSRPLAPRGPSNTAPTRPPFDGALPPQTYAPQPEAPSPYSEAGAMSPTTSGLPSPTRPPHIAFRPLRVQPVERGPETDTLVARAARGETAEMRTPPSDVDGISVLADTPMARADERTPRAEPEQNAEQEQWPDRLSELEKRAATPEDLTPPTATPMSPPANPYSDLWEMHTESSSGMPTH